MGTLGVPFGDVTRQSRKMSRNQRIDTGRYPTICVLPLPMQCVRDDGQRTREQRLFAD